jgi:LysM repeat protein
MKRIFCFMLLTLSITFTNPPARGQDAATEEKLNKLSGQIEDLLAARAADQKKMAEMAREIESLREQVSKPTGNYASQDDMKRLAEVVKEIDRKRMEDYDKIQAQMVKIGKVVASAPAAPPARKSPPGTSKNSDTNASDKAAPPEKGYEYVIQSGDTLSAIVHAYKEKNIKVTSDQILKANPGLKANALRPGQKIWIPAPEGQ